MSVKSGGVARFRRVALAAAACMWIALAVAARAATFTPIYTFDSQSDGIAPGLYFADASGALYGTAGYGGTATCEVGTQGCGTIFKLTPPVSGANWTKTDLYDFAGGTDGFAPGSLVMDGEGNIYGTSSIPADLCGDGLGCSSIFQLSPPAAGATAWTLTTIMTLTLGTNGFVEQIVLGNAGDLYGITYNGALSACANNGCGIIFHLSPPAAGQTDWTMATLYQFTGGTNGSSPVSILLAPNGTLFGTFYGGGYSNCVAAYTFCGGVFKLTPPARAGGAWKEGSADIDPNTVGYLPGSLVLGGGGQLFGTASEGISPNAGSVFSISQATPTSVPVWQAISKFSDNDQVAGVNPFTLVRARNGVMFGLTGGGGLVHCTIDGTLQGCGTVFQLTPPAAGSSTWTRSLLYSFTGGQTDGAFPQSLIVGPGGALYGTTDFFPPYVTTPGVVFQITP